MIAKQSEKRKEIKLVDLPAYLDSLGAGEDRPKVTKLEWPDDSPTPIITISKSEKVLTDEAK